MASKCLKIRTINLSCYSINKWTQNVQIKTREFSVNAISYETTLINSYLPFCYFLFSTTLLQLGVYKSRLRWFPLGSRFMTFLLGLALKAKFGDFPLFLFSSFLIFLLQLLAFHWACLQFKNFQERTI